MIHLEKKLMINIEETNKAKAGFIKDLFCFNITIILVPKLLKYFISLHIISIINIYFNLSLGFFFEG